MCEALSPAFPGSKRLFDEAHEDVDSPCDRAQGKRVRFAANSPSGRCWGGPALQQPALHPSTLNALRALFPDMDDQVSKQIQYGRFLACGGRLGWRHSRVFR
jgi:hypothetical protein